MVLKGLHLSFQSSYDSNHFSFIRLQLVETGCEQTYWMISPERGLRQTLAISDCSSQETQPANCIALSVFKGTFCVCVYSHYGSNTEQTSITIMSGLRCIKIFEDKISTLLGVSVTYCSFMIRGLRQQDSISKAKISNEFLHLNILQILEKY